MRIQRNLGSAAVNVFDTKKIEMPPLHESVSRSIAAKCIRMMFRIQQAENKPKYFLSRPKLKNKPAYRSKGHVSNFYIVDLENFATASRRIQVIYTTRPSSVCL